VALKGNAPTEPKVSNSSLTALIVTLITAALTYVYRGNIPAAWQPVIPGVAAGISAYAAGWLSKHQPRYEEVVAAVQKVIATQKLTAFQTNYPGFAEWGKPTTSTPTPQPPESPPEMHEGGERK
jgi:hypothetical protein